jgi:hypothetical protein
MWGRPRKVIFDDEGEDTLPAGGGMTELLFRDVKP